MGFNFSTILKKAMAVIKASPNAVCLSLQEILNFLAKSSKEYLSFLCTTVEINKVLT